MADNNNANGQAGASPGSGAQTNNVQDPAGSGSIGTVDKNNAAPEEPPMDIKEYLAKLGWGNNVEMRHTTLAEAHKAMEEAAKASVDGSVEFVIMPGLVAGSQGDAAQRTEDGHHGGGGDTQEVLGAAPADAESAQEE